MTGRRVRGLFSGLLVLVAASVCMPSRAAAASDASAIRAVLEQQAAAWNRGDVDTFMQGYKNAPDTTFVGATMRKGYQVVRDDYRKHYASKAEMGRLTFSDIEVRPLPEASGPVRYAVVTGHFHLDREVHGEAPADDGVFSLVWEKTADGWKIIVDHTS